MRVLVVEDEIDIRNSLKNSLQEVCFAVDTAEDGEAGSFLARTNEYDIIILDNILPKKTGYEVCKELRKEGITTPIIILSVRSETLTKVDLLNAGADDYLTKPYSFQELIARMHALLRRPKQFTGDVLALGDLTLDINKQLVERAGKEIRLTRKEFTLLAYLMRNCGNVLSRSMIMEHVWDMNSDPFSNTIETHILSLRRKIGCTKKHRIITTIPGRGYRVDMR